jgi:hypothetical protein
MHKKVIKVSLGLSMMLVSVLGVSAQTAPDVQVAVPTLYSVEPVTATVGDVDPTQTSTCVSLTSDALRYRSSDATTNGEVSVLQDFLVATSVLKSQVTGYFGLATFSAVKQFQKRTGLNPTGYVGPLTKAKIKDISCNGAQLPDAPGATNGKSQPSQPGQPGVAPRPMLFDNGSGTPPMPRPPVNGSSSPFPPMYGSTTPGFPPVPPQGTGTPNMPPVACTAIAQLCPDGRMMARNPMTCEWITASCGTSGSTSSPVTPRPVPVPPVMAKPPVTTGSATMTPATPVRPTGIMCTMEMRMCPNGTPVPRDANCVWHTEKCATTNPVQTNPGAPMPATGI